MDKLRKFWDNIKGSLFFIFIFSSALMLLVYFGCWLFFRPFFTEHKEKLRHLYEIALAVLSPGVFAAILKYFQFIGIFEMEMNKIIVSSSFESTLQKSTNLATHVAFSSFESKLQESINQTIYSVEFLSRQRDLETIWRNSTICIFKSHFPNISEKVESRLSNDLFKPDILDYYYKNYQIKIHVSLENGTHLKIEEISHYTVVRPDIKESVLKFEYSIPKTGEDISSKLSIETISINEQERAAFRSYENGATPEVTDITYEYKIEGELEYNVKHTITLIYPLAIDNEYIFHCARLLEDLTAEMTVDKVLKCIFVPISNYKMDITPANGGYSCCYRGILLPNNGFRTYFFKQ